MTRIGVGALLGLALASCSTGTSSTTTPATFSEVYPLIFPQTTKAQCDFCHGLPPNEKSNGKLSCGTDRETAYQALVGKTSTSANCAGKPFVVPGKPDESLVVTKLTTPTCGERMPLGGSPLSADQVDMIRSWISAGAKDD